VVRALFCLALALAGCAVPGETCGRGRCHEGSTCVSLFGPGRRNQGWDDPLYPNVEIEWWCEQDCPEGIGCDGGKCLLDPANYATLMCGGDRLELMYYTSGVSCLCDQMGMCYFDQPVSGMELIDGCTAGAPVLKTCVPNEDCSTGELKAGATLPGVRLYFAGNGYEFAYCPGRPANTLHSVLPTGAHIRVWADSESCAGE
jgi:hypothetical protein